MEFLGGSSEVGVPADRQKRATVTDFTDHRYFRLWNCKLSIAQNNRGPPILLMFRNGMCAGARPGAQNLKIRGADAKGLSCKD